MGMRGLQRERENCKESREEWSREREDCKGNGRTAKRVERNGEWSREGLAKKAEAGRNEGGAHVGTRGLQREREDCKGNGRTAKRVERNGVERGLQRKPRLGGTEGVRAWEREAWHLHGTCRQHSSHCVSCARMTWQRRVTEKAGLISVYELSRGPF